MASPPSEYKKSRRPGAKSPDSGNNAFEIFMRYDLTYRKKTAMLPPNRGKPNRADKLSQLHPVTVNSFLSVFGRKDFILLIYTHSIA